MNRYADVMYHDMLSPEETQAIRAEARAISDRVVRPRARMIANGDERVEGFPQDVFDALALSGLMRVPFPRDVGGRGLRHPATATASVVEELAYHSNSVAAIFDVHCILAGNALNQGVDEQRQRWLPRLLDGSSVGAFATSEPGSSTDLSPEAIKTVATRTDHGWTLAGVKRWITNSPVADVIVVLARTGSSLSTFIVDTSLPGVSVGQPDRKMGNRGQLTADVRLDSVKLSDDALLGTEGGGLRVALSTLTYGRIGIAAAGVGMAQSAFDKTAEHLKRRQVFGAPLGTKQHWQMLMARRAAELESARTLYLKAALRLDSGTSFPEPEAAMAKALGTELSVHMARDAIQAHGGLGFIAELGSSEDFDPVEHIYRDSKIGEIYEGANEIQWWIVARNILGRDIAG
ncbi:acyl-CoA dehydrogenase family protein [Nocardioides daejeonensis]|uniref:acyl-CoA dehydrogenase family protein n=1 Tax=Nocardioides daejeonensis TaxID=1046556 RepID=UPI000D74DD35|nr:acyl-CoA dehydrogenase family protein [Nocardioides daejeonensis]